ncbi:3-deoxy-manno-octulosonate cytidylyltransferase [Pirellulimonas nuda]|uniref:3-deoxy-manno-octulosonate cytidylyltransferase n=1 Tax=Pirellulimonas nuda TaxID=2528009 RepID=A0A518D9M3_9BACT|nr:3-deoxy-manno-octulosonate cytidylyltransferase [Pirellulimonas nuda]QDU88181.1 3-deoxy-manno-octulosonate cytidylyltransferase [Pirellulimonas nuda]
MPAPTKLLAVIPARYASQRFPGKPLALVGGIPMVVRVHRATAQSGVFGKTVVATDDQRIAEVVTAAGGEVEITRADHATGTDRVAEVAARYPDYDVVANVQGDQPFVHRGLLEALVAPYLRGERPEMTTIGCPLPADGADDPNVVTVITGVDGRALYFSRSAIPYPRNPGPAPAYHHLGLYAFRSDFLAQYAQLTPTPLEASEGLEQLRVLEHGYTIGVSLVDASVPEVNTPEELEAANRLAADWDK